MKALIRSVLIVATLVLLSQSPVLAREGQSAFPSARPETVGLSSKKLQRLDGAIRQWVADGDLVGAELLIVKDGRAVFHRAYGWSDRQERRPLVRNSIFSIKSMSKPFTATAILMLAREGKLSLDDPVRRYIPAFPSDRITIRHLLTHTSGYGGLADTGDPRTVPSKGHATLRAWVDAWAAKGPTGPIGQFSYCDLNYMALGVIIQAVSGAPPDVFIERHIFRPLGLHHTFAHFTPAVPWAKRVPSLYIWNPESDRYERARTHRDAWPWKFYPAAFGLFSTAMDYAKFMSVWMNKGAWAGGRLLPENTVEQALRLQASDGVSGGYGYGWEIKDAPRRDGMPSIFFHTGYDGTLAMAIPAQRTIIIYLTQSRGPQLAAFTNLLGSLQIFDSPGPYNLQTMAWAGDQHLQTATLSPENAATYVGTYRGVFPAPPGSSPLGVVVEVRQQAGALKMAVRFNRHHGVEEDYDLVPLRDGSFAPGRYRGNVLEEVSPMRYRFKMEKGRAIALDALMHGHVLFSADRKAASRASNAIPATASSQSF
jgi:CubicO group peptidase (beta-lactamase class C family)